MVDMLAKAQQWLATVRKDSLATVREISYVRRCTGETIRLTGKGVVIGNADERLDSSTFGAMDVEERDYILPREVFEDYPSILAIGPEMGDVVIETGEDLVRYKFRVVPQGGEVAWEWHDRERTAYRVHCNLIGVE